MEIISHNRTSLITIDKFTEKVKVLNESGVDAIYNEDYQTALVYLQEA